jgi:thiamine pyrophosphokinase
VEDFLLPRIVILANGNLPDIEKARTILRQDDFILCADGGTRHASSLHLQPALVIGDLDSAGEATLQALRAEGVAIEQHPRDKDETDLELAIARALEMEPEEIVIVAALGGRLDQTLGNIALLSSIRHPSPDIRLDDGVEEVLLCRDQSRVHGRSGDIVSLLPWQGAVGGIHTTGLKWSLRDETLYPEKTRGISNEMTGHTASIQVRSGMLLVIHRRQS